VLLRNLCEGSQAPAQKVTGRRLIPFSDAIYGMVTKVYTTVSGRRASTDIRACAAEGKLARAPHYNSIFNYFDRADVTPVLVSLVEQRAAPLAGIETDFAVDCKGFSTSVYRRWFDAKYGREMAESTWLKAHAMVGTKTNIVTSISMTDSHGSDSPELPALVATTAKRFALPEVSADKAYIGNANLAAIETAGAIPFVPFKSNSRSAGSPAWRRMWGLFLYRSDEFMAAYHKRSNVEATFSAIKRKFGGSVRSKKYVAQVNEILCKVLCHNLRLASLTRCTSLGSSRTLGLGSRGVIDLTTVEHANVLVALRHLRVQIGGRRPLANGLGFSRHTLRHVRMGEKNVSPSMAVRSLGWPPSVLMTC